MTSIDLDSFLEFIAGRPDPAAIEALRPLSRADLASLARAVRAALDSCPIPIERGQRARACARRERLVRAQALIEARKGDPTRLIGVARARWVEGGAHLDYLKLMVAFGRRVAALDLAFALLEREALEGFEEVDRFIAETLAIPDGYDAAVSAYLRDPSAERFEPLLRFSPVELAAHRVRYTVRRLLTSGADPSALLEVAGERALTEEMQARIDAGDVPTATLARLSEKHPASRTDFLGLAARSACARGDQLGTIRHLRGALDLPGDATPRAREHLELVRSLAGPELLELMDRAGLR